MISLFYGLFAFFYWVITADNILPPHLKNEIYGIVIMVELFVEFVLGIFLVAFVETYLDCRRR